MNLSWGAASDNVGVTGYEILRDGAPIATVGAVTSYADTTVSPLTHYDYVVKALDAAGNRSAAEQHRGRQHAGAARQHDGDVRRGRRRARRAGPPDHQLRDVVEAARDERPARWRATCSSRLPASPAPCSRPSCTSSTPTTPRTTARRSTRRRAPGRRPASRGTTALPARVCPSDNKVQIAIGTWVEYDVAPLVTGNGDVTFVLVGDSTDGANFASKEYTRPEQEAAARGDLLQLTPGPAPGRTLRGTDASWSRPGAAWPPSQAASAARETQRLRVRDRIGLRRPGPASHRRVARAGQRRELRSRPRSRIWLQRFGVHALARRAWRVPAVARRPAGSPSAAITSPAIRPAS